MSSIETPNIIFTDNAARKVYELISDEQEDLFLRVYITGGGCSGFQYGFSFDDNITEDDIVVRKQIEEQTAPVDVCLLIDPLSFQYLEGAEIDYEEDLQASQFVIKNPNAATTCGCGSSFAVT